MSGDSGSLGRCANRPSIRVWHPLGGARADARGMRADARGMGADPRGAWACRRRCVIGKAPGDPAEAKGGGPPGPPPDRMDLPLSPRGSGPLSQSPVPSFHCNFYSSFALERVVDPARHLAASRSATCDYVRSGNKPRLEDGCPIMAARPCATAARRRAAPAAGAFWPHRGPGRRTSRLVPVQDQSDETLTAASSPVTHRSSISMASRPPPARALDARP